MKNNCRTLASLLIFSFVIALLGAAVLYKLFPESLFKIVYIVHESGGTEEERIIKNIQGNSQYIEYFHPEESYLKSIVLHMGCLGDLSQDSNRNMTVNMKLLKNDGAVLTEKNLLLEAIEGLRFQEISVESFVETGQEYRVLITFPDSGNLFITTSMKEIGPGEHVRLMVNGEKSEETLYMQYIYGAYSRKLLMMWFLVFFATVFLIVERWFFIRRKQINLQEI